MEEPTGQSAPFADKLTIEQVVLIVRRMDGLPTLPAVAVRLLALTTGPAAAATDEQAVLEALGRLIAADPALAARVLSLANAASPGRARTPLAAVRQLGFDAVRSVVLSSAACGAMGPSVGGGGALDRPAFWRHCQAVAAAARLLAEAVHLPLDGEEVFACGLLHDLGKLALAHAVPKSHARALAAARTRRGRLAECEKRTIGVDHLVVGRRLARQWHLPPTVENVIWLHHQPPEAIPPSVAEARLIRVVSLADALVRRERIGDSGNGAVAGQPEEAARRLGLSEAALSDVAARLGEAVQACECAPPADRADTERIYRDALAGANVELGRLNEQLRRRSRALAAQAEAFDHLREFAAALVPDAGVSDVLLAAAGVFRGAPDLAPDAGRAIVAYAVDEGGGSVLAVRLEGGEPPAWRGFALAGGSRPAGAAGAPDAAAVSALLADRTEWDGWVAFRDGVHQPLLCGARWMGGVLYPARADGPPDAGEADEARRGLAAALGMALAIVQQRCRAVALSEELAAASQELAQTREALAEARTLAAVGDLAAGAAHELNNPLAVVSGRAQLMREKARTKAERETWRLIADQAQRISDIVTELMEFASPPQPAPAALDAAELLAAAAKTFSSSDHPQAKTARVDITTDDSTPAIWADGSQVRAVLVELITNAANAATGSAGVRLSAQADESGGAVLLSVEDDGAGMDRQTVARAWTPFFSAQEAGRRRGLGLPKAKRTIERNGGRIWIDSGPGQGTTVTVQLPCVRGSAGRGQAPGPER